MCPVALHELNEWESELVLKLPSIVKVGGPHRSSPLIIQNILRKYFTFVLTLVVFINCLVNNWLKISILYWQVNTFRGAYSLWNMSSVRSTEGIDSLIWRITANSTATKTFPNWVTVRTGTHWGLSSGSAPSPQWVRYDYFLIYSINWLLPSNGNQFLLITSSIDIHFLCLGDWESHSGERYLALMDLREEPEARPKYRCGVSPIVYYCPIYPLKTIVYCFLTSITLQLNYLWFFPLIGADISLVIVQVSSGANCHPITHFCNYFTFHFWSEMRFLFVDQIFLTIILVRLCSQSLSLRTIFNF